MTYAAVADKPVLQTQASGVWYTFQQGEVVAIIPARAGSKGIPGKNIKLLGGKPLIVWTIEAARNSGVCDRVFVTTEDEEIAEIARQAGAEIIMRPPEYAMDGCQLDDVYVNAYNQIVYKELAHPDVLIFLAPPSPFRTAGDIHDALEEFRNTKELSTVIGCYRDVGFHWLLVTDETDDEFGQQMEPIMHNPERRLGRQWVNPNDWLLRESGALYIVDAVRFAAYRTQRIPPFVPFIMEPEHSVDLDEPRDWLLAEAILNGQTP